jgi:hypothetical protein
MDMTRIDVTEINNSPSACLYCAQTSDDVPLIQLHYRGEKRWICAQHLPILIHQPGKLASKLPGADRLNPSEEHHH